MCINKIIHKIPMVNQIGDPKEEIAQATSTIGSNYDSTLASCKDILKELQVDWDAVFAENFNPLHLALKLNSNSILNKDFIEMSNRIENVLNKIIDSNPSGFSESFNAFASFRDKNTEIIKDFDCILDNISEIKNTKLQGISSEKNEIDELKRVYGICEKIVELRNTFSIYQCSNRSSFADGDAKRSSYDDENLMKKAGIISQCISLSGDKDLLEIDGVYEYSKLIKSCYLEINRKFYKKIFDFIFKNKIENLYFFQGIVTLGSFEEFDKFCRENFEQGVFYEIECVIVEDSNSISKNDEDYGQHFRLSQLCKKICDKVSSILENTRVIVEKSGQTFETAQGTDFFGKKSEKKLFIMSIDEPMEMIKKNVINFIELYSNTAANALRFEKNLENKTVEIDLQSFEIDYPAIYGDHPIVERFENKSCFRNIRKEKFSIFISPNDQTTNIFMKEIREPEIRTFLRKYAESNYLSTAAIEKSFCKIDEIFMNEFRFRTDPSTGVPLLSSEILKIVKDCRSIEEERILKGYIKKKMFYVFMEDYDEMFRSIFVRKEAIKTLLSVMDSKRSETPKIRAGNSVTDFDESKIDSKEATTDNNKGGDKKETSKKNKESEKRIRVGLLPKSFKYGNKKRTEVNDTNEEETKRREESLMKDFKRNEEVFTIQDKIKDLSAYVVSKEDFKDMLLKNRIDKDDLFIKPMKYIKASAITSVTDDLGKCIGSAETTFLSQLFFQSLKNQACLDFFYYFDLFYRQGNYTFYMRKMIDILFVISKNAKSVFEEFHEDFEDVLIFYCVMNIYSIHAKSRADLQIFVENLEILGEILGEVVLSYKFKDLISFFRDKQTISGYDEKYTRILIQKIH